MNVVALLAHPDDELMCAGTLARFVDEGHNVTLVTAFLSVERTDERIAEGETASDIIGCEYLPILWPSEKSFTWGQEWVRELDSRIATPDLFITHRVQDDNTSHSPLGKVARTLARRNQTGVWEIDQTIPGGLTDHPQPNHYVNITNQYDVKTEAVSAYRSQLAKYPGLAEAIAHRDRYYGWCIGVPAAEGFTTVKGVWL